VVILVAPRPTNANPLAVGTIDLRRAIPLVPAAVAAYLVAIGALKWLEQPLVLAFTRAGAALCALPSYSLALAWWLWTSAPAAAGQRSLPVTPRHVFLATLLNPKLAVFASVAFPTLPTWGAAAPFAAGFGVAAALDGGLWLCRGLPQQA
jgi:hypothetical protein